MTEYQRGLEAAAKKVKELWHHPYADELAAAIRGLSPQPDYSWGFCDVHTGMHAYFAKPGQKSSACVNWRKVEAEDSVEVPQPATMSTFRCDCGRNLLVEGKVIGKESPGIDPLAATPPTPQPELEKLVAAVQEFLKHDGGPGSENYDASKIYHARRSMQSAFGFRCPRCGETLPHLYDENCTDYRRAGIPVEPQPTKKWMHLPNEQTWWWHWNGEDLAIPHIYSVMVSKTLNDRYFIAYPDSRWCDELGGFWLKVQYPNVPSRTEQKSLAGVEQPTPKEAK